MTPAPDEWPDAGPAMTPLAAAPDPEPKPAPVAKDSAKPKPKARAKRTPAAATIKKAGDKSKTIRAKKVDL